MSALPQLPPGGDIDAQETREWLDALSAVVATEGRERGHFLIEQLLESLEEKLASVELRAASPEHLDTAGKNTAAVGTKT